MRSWQKICFLFAFVLVGLVALPEQSAACGGFFCQNSPVDQNAERIIFTDNGDGTITSLIQIQYTGDAPDFSWILPIPTPITNDDIAVPEGADAAFTELEISTNPRYLRPPLPECAQVMMMDMAVAEAEEGGVEIFAEGEVGPFGFVVIGSEDPNAVVDWLRENEYRVEPPMEPLIDVYVEESFVFLAMRLLPDAGADEISPVQITYAADAPMIPLRLTAVAANPNMAVLVWFFGDAPAKPTNFAHMEIPDEDIIFWDFGGNNYRSLVSTYADRNNGQAFVTEYAQPTDAITFADPLLVDLASKHRYLTRLNTVISPEEMTVDPSFAYDPELPDVDNVHDLSDAVEQYECMRNEATTGVVAAVDEAIRGEEAVLEQNDSAPYQPSLAARVVTGLLVFLGAVFFLGVVVFAASLLGRRNQK